MPDQSTRRPYSNRTNGEAWQERTCAHCGETFRFKRSLAFGPKAGKNPGLYCSRSCANAGRTRRIEITCERCGKKRLVFPSQANRRFCSTECAGNAPSTLEAMCVVCGTRYRVTASQMSYTKCCSRACMTRYKSTQPYRHDEHPHYRLFNREWRELRLQIIERDGGVCTRCGGTDRLSAHHITPHRISHDDSPENLVTLCNSCHHIVERETERLMFAR